MPMVVPFGLLLLFAPNPVARYLDAAKRDDTGRGYANNMAELLVERPRVKLKVCGRSTAQDIAHCSDRADESGADDGASKDAATGVAGAERQSSEGRVAAEVLKERATGRYGVIRSRSAASTSASGPNAVRTIPPMDDQGEPRAEIRF